MRGELLAKIFAEKSRFYWECLVSCMKTRKVESQQLKNRCFEAIFGYLIVYNPLMHL